MSISERRRSSVTRDAIATNAPLIREQMKLEKVAQAVSETEGMLTTDQLNALYQRMTPEEERKSMLLEFVCQKGDEKREQFLQCLKDSGHVDLAHKIQTDIDKLMKRE